MKQTVRTTVTLDADIAALVKHVMRERGLSFKEVVNDAIRRGLGREKGASDQPFRTKTFSMGWCEGVRADGALELAGELEDEELARRLAARK